MSKRHFVTSPEPVSEKVGVSVCGKAVRVLRQIETDADLQQIELSSLAGCRKCAEGKLERYVYVAQETK